MNRQPRNARQWDPWRMDKPSSVLSQHVTLFRDVFVHRTHPILMQQEDGSYRKEERNLTQRDVVDHLLGFVTLGILPYPDGTVKLGAVDVDYASPDVMADVFACFDARQLPHLTFVSGRKGFHVVVFFAQPTPLDKARAVLALVAGSHEIWPRQTRLEPGRLGNCIKAPLGMHRVTRRGCVAVDRSFMRIHDPWQLIRDVPRINADDVLASSSIERQDRIVRPCPRPETLPASMKPCLTGLFKEGVEMGQRNNTGFALATELRRLGCAQSEAQEALDRWNRLSRPPAGDRELASICRSAYRRPEPYEYGCSPDGGLRQLVGKSCVGRSTCPYHQQLLKTLRQTRKHSASDASDNAKTEETRE